MGFFFLFILFVVFCLVLVFWLVFGVGGVVFWWSFLGFFVCFIFSTLIVQ